MILVALASHLLTLNRCHADGEAFVIDFGHIRFVGFPCEDSLAIASCLHGYLEGMTHSDITRI